MRKDFGNVEKLAKAAESFRLPDKPIFSSSASENGELYAPETSFMKETSVHIKNTWIKQLCNRKVRDFAMVYRHEKFPGLLTKGPMDAWKQLDTVATTGLTVTYG